MTSRTGLPSTPPAALIWSSAVSTAMRRLAPVLASGPVISQDAPIQGSARCASPGSANNVTARAAHMPRTPRRPKLSFTASMAASPELPARCADDRRAIAVPKSLSELRLQEFFGDQFGEASPNRDAAARSGDHGHHVLAAPHERLNAGSVIIHAREEVVEG